ncbi:hypothetical protein JTE90_026368 [Oedothorax gibbosus]|uniref:Uncharacterized protein n=1 Tax=Oedothorax gibbosus TaxID=931172 RepID=A0AAV6VFA9_9ARAC|nr:hypothetical protein JTE90_026368 [Oedothorax gibbosus]
MLACWNKDSRSDPVFYEIQVVHWIRSSSAPVCHGRKQSESVPAQHTCTTTPKRCTTHRRTGLGRGDCVKPGQAGHFY